MISAQYRGGLMNRRITHPWVGFAVLWIWRLYDLLAPKRRDHWAFFTHPLKPAQFIENSRAVYEHVKNDDDLHCWIFVRGAQQPLGLSDSDRQRVVELDTLAGLFALARCGVLLLTNSVALDLSMTWANGSFAAPRPSMRRRSVVNLWHGIPLKALFALANPEQRSHGDRIRFRRRERRHYDGLVASSSIDSHSMAAIFPPLPPQNVWITGLPRNDFLLLPEADLPCHLNDELERIRELRGDRRLVLYVPTYRDAAVALQGSYTFSGEEVLQLEQLLRKHNAVLGLRGHYLANAASPLDARHLGRDGSFLDLGHGVFQEVSALLREAALVVTDFSSVYIDALYLHLPVVGFAFDLEHFRTQQNGLLYDLELAFPGPMTTDFASFLEALDITLSGDHPVASERYEAARRMFFRYQDASNASRLVQRLHSLLETQART